MSPELIAILGIGIALAGLLLRLETSIDTLRSDLSASSDSMKNDPTARMESMTADIARMDGMQAELREARDRLSRLGGKVDILQDDTMRRDFPR